MTYEEYIQEPEITIHECFTKKTAEGYYTVCDYIKCTFKDGPFSRTYAYLRGIEHADAH